MVEINVRKGRTVGFHAVLVTFGQVTWLCAAAVCRHASVQHKQNRHLQCMQARWAEDHASPFAITKRCSAGGAPHSSSPYLACHPVLQAAAAECLRATRRSVEGQPHQAAPSAGDADAPHHPDCSGGTPAHAKMGDSVQLNMCTSAAADP